MKHSGATLRDLMTQKTVMCPGAWNGLVAKAIAQTDFQACYISGGATANSVGHPDIGLISLAEMCVKIREITSACNLPVIVDADTGYENISQTIVEYEKSGAAGMHVEDQVFPKRCGHLEGKELISTEDMSAKLSLAVKSRSDSNFIIIARTDARGVDGLDAAIERGLAFREAGADMIFPEGLHSKREFETFAEGCPGLLLANMTEFGKTPFLGVDEFANIGYQLVIYPITMQRVAMNAVIKSLSKLKDAGSAESFVDKMQTRAELYKMLEYSPEVD